MRTLVLGVVGQSGGICSSSSLQGWFLWGGKLVEVCVSGRPEGVFLLHESDVTSSVF